MSSANSVLEFPLGQNLLTVFDYAVDGLFKVPPDESVLDSKIQVGEREYTWREFLWVIAALPISKRLVIDINHETDMTLHEYLGPHAWPMPKSRTYYEAAEALLTRLTPAFDSTEADLQ